MLELLIGIVIVLLIINSFLLYKIFKREDDNTIKNAIENYSKNLLEFETRIKDEFTRNREEQNKNFYDQRREMLENFNKLSLDIFDKLEKFRFTVDNSLKSFQEILKNDNKENRNELKLSLDSFGLKFKESTNELNNLLKLKFDELLNNQKVLITENENKLENIRNVLETNLKNLQEENSKKLDEMKVIVDEKLQSTLEKRFNSSFNLISERLEQVQRGLGEMQNLAIGVGDLKKVLSNVKTRGVFGEYQLGNLLEQLLTPEQYSQNVKTKPESNDLVEYAIKLPGRGESEKPVWLPIDAKFPIEDYQNLQNAIESGDINLIERFKKELENRIKSFAKSIKDKYVDPPHTTDFGIMFLPFESLYAEVLRIPGLFEFINNNYKVVITGPTTISAILNSLQMGFKSLAIEKKSSKVWELLGVIKNEFYKFGDLLDKTSEQLRKTQNTLDDASKKTRTIQRKLKAVEQPNQIESEKLLDINNDESEIF